MVRAVRFELTTNGLKVRCATAAPCSHFWQGMMDSNHRMLESKSSALPTWRIPYIFGTQIFKEQYYGTMP